MADPNAAVPSRILPPGNIAETGRDNVQFAVAVHILGEGHANVSPGSTLVNRVPDPCPISRTRVFPPLDAAIAVGDHIEFSVTVDVTDAQDVDAAAVNRYGQAR